MIIVGMKHVILCVCPIMSGLGMTGSGPSIFVLSILYWLVSNLLSLKWVQFSYGAVWFDENQHHKFICKALRGKWKKKRGNNYVFHESLYPSVNLFHNFVPEKKSISMIKFF